MSAEGPGREAAHQQLPDPASGALGVSGDPADRPHLETQDLMRGSGGNLLSKREGAGETARRSPCVRPATWQAFYQAHWLVL